MKRHFARILTALLLLALLPGLFIPARAAISGQCGKDLTWEFDAVTRVLSISGTGPMEDYAYPNHKNIPWAEFKDQIRHIVIEYGVTTISENAFEVCKELRTVEIADSVTSIGTDAFSRCVRLETVRFPENLKEIGKSAFMRCGLLRDVVLPEGLEVMENQAFDSCLSLERIVIPEGLEKLDSCVFQGCTSLKEVQLPQSLKRICSEAFSGCTALTAIRLPQGLEMVGWGAFRDCTGLKSIQIPEGVKTIEGCAFAECTGLTEVVIPDSVEEIRREAFRNCTGLTEIAFPENAYVEESALLGCVNIKGYAWNVFWKALPGVLIGVGSAIISIACLVIAVIWAFSWGKQWLQDRKEAGKTFPRRKFLRTGLIILAAVVGYMGFTAVVNKLLGRELEEYREVSRISVSHMGWGEAYVYTVDFENSTFTYAIAYGGDSRRVIRSKELDPEALQEFADACSEYKLLGWGPKYTNPGVMDGHQWTISIVSADGETEYISGSNAYPDTWKEMACAFYELTGENCLHLRGLN